MERSEQMAELITALAKAQAEMRNPGYDSTNPHFRTRYASLAAVRDAVIPPLAANGLAITQLVTTEGEEVVCQTILWHASGQFLSETLRMPVSKTDAQGYGGAITYARRYALQAMCNVSGDEDEDGNTARTPGVSGGQTAISPKPGAPKPGAPNQAAAEWMEKINTLIKGQGADQERIDRYWRQVAHKYGDAWSASLGMKLYGELSVAAQAKAKTAPSQEPTPDAKPAPPQRPSMSTDGVWENTLRAHRDTLAEMVIAERADVSRRDQLAALVTEVDAVLIGEHNISHTEGHKLADAVLAWIDEGK